jgi:hypothetical protein
MGKRCPMNLGKTQARFGAGDPDRTNDLQFTKTRPRGANAASAQSGKSDGSSRG